jgi:hypothetical protein
MDINTQQLKSDPKKVGELQGDDVMEVMTKGGLVMIVAKAEGKRMRTLGVGPHRAVARYIAHEREKDLRWTELSKSAKTAFDKSLLPTFRVLTDRCESLGSRK